MAAAVKSTEHQRDCLEEDITKCAICLEVYHDPRKLPCLHTFCFACLDKVIRKKMPPLLGQQQKLGGASNKATNFNCPLCRQSYPLTDGGAGDFPCNYFIAALSHSKVADRSSGGSIVVDLCEACSVENDDELPAVSVPAEVFCRDCSQKLCKRCAVPHRRWAAGSHEVVPLTADVSIELIRRRSLACDSCPGEVVKMYCVDCRKNICLVCVETDHVGHARKKIAIAAAEIALQMDDDVTLVSTLRDDIASQRIRMESECDRFLTEIGDAQVAIERQGEQLKRLIDERIASNVEKLRSVARTFEKKKATQRDRHQLVLTSLNGFISYATELREKGKPHDVTGGARQVHERAAELMNVYGPDRMKSKECWAPIVEVTANRKDDLLQLMDNFGGLVARANVFNFSRGLFCVRRTDKRKTIKCIQQCIVNRISVHSIISG
jgi:hypothetical protein